MEKNSYQEFCMVRTNVKLKNRLAPDQKTNDCNITLTNIRYLYTSLHMSIIQGAIQNLTFKSGYFLAISKILVVRVKSLNLRD